MTDATRAGAALLTALLVVAGCSADDTSPDTEPTADQATEPPAGDGDGDEGESDEGEDGEAGPPPEDPPLVDGQPLSSEVVTDELVALLDAELSDGEVCDALGLDEAELRELSRGDDGVDHLADESPMYDDVFDGFIGCTAPTSFGVGDEGTPTTMPGIGVDLYRFDVTPDDASVEGEVVTSPAGRTARLSGFEYDPEDPEVGSAVTWTIYSLEQGAAVRVSGHLRSAGSTPEGLGGLLDEVADRFA